MEKFLKNKIVVAFAVCFIAMIVAINTLKIVKKGPAASLSAQEWIKGGPVDVKDKENIYVVEFWTTWCPPCRTTIPHLTALQRKYQDKGVVFIGVSDEPPSTVRPFVAQMGDQMDYAVMCDKGGRTADAYMRAYGENGIPHAFIVGKDGRVVWHGHPMDGLDEKLQSLLVSK